MVGIFFICIFDISKVNKLNKLKIRVMIVQELINELEKVKDKSIHVELCDLVGDRYIPTNVDILYDGEDSHERNVDIDFSTNGYSKAIPEFIQKMDWNLLRDQKENLISISIEHPLSESLNGIICLIDSLQDYAVDVIKMNEETIFGENLEK